MIAVCYNNLHVKVMKLMRYNEMFLLFKECGSSQETEEFTFYLRDEEGNVMSEFKSNFCPSEQTPFLSQTSFLAKENNFYFNGKIKATEKIEGYHNQSCPIWNFYHQDHLGNTRVITDENGNILAEHKYFPYGEELTSQTQDTLSHKFTGHERDFESNLDYMLARYYSSFQGRFLNPDPKKGGVERNSQKFNLYSYVINNPIRYTDPEGESLADIWQSIKDFWCAIFGCNEESKTDEDKEKEEKNEEEKKEDQDKTTEKQELYQEAGIEDTSRASLMGTQSGFGPKANKELKEAGEYVAKKGAEIVVTVASIKSLSELWKIKQITGPELVNILKKFGAQAKPGGRHTKVTLNGLTASVPTSHKGESLDIGTFRGILKQLKIPKVNK